jgi:hypothetical protein
VGLGRRKTYLSRDGAVILKDNRVPAPAVIAFMCEAILKAVANEARRAARRDASMLILLHRCSSAFESLILPSAMPFGVPSRQRESKNFRSG